MKMWFGMKIFFLQILWCSFFVDLQSKTLNHYKFVVKEANYTRLCHTTSILTVNGKFPGPTMTAHKGDTVYVNVYNKGRYNITLHWHGVKQPMNPWPDDLEHITQCPIKPRGKFKQKVIFSREEGTLWWHARSDWSRAAVHGAIIVYPIKNSAYPFPKPAAEVPIILGEWWKKDVKQVYMEFLKTGGSPNTSDAITINGRPGDLYPCSKSDTFKLNVDQGKIYLLRVVNAAMNLFFFFSISKHKLMVVGADGNYTKPLTRDYICIAPGQTIDALMFANKEPNRYSMASRAYSSGAEVPFVNKTTTAILKYSGNYAPCSSPSLPYLPSYNDTHAAFHFFGSIRGLPEKYSHKVPLNINSHIVTPLSTNTFSCPKGHSCEEPNEIASSMNSLSFGNPSIEILEAWYSYISGVFTRDFPNLLPLLFDLTEKYLPLILEILEPGTKVKVLNYGTTVELVFQGTNMVAGMDHPMHLHGYSFHVVGYGFGKFNKDKDPMKYNLIDPPLLNTVPVPKNGWAAIRIKASNPGVWFMHCLLNRRLSPGMETVFLVKNGKGSDETLLPPS